MDWSVLLSADVLGQMLFFATPLLLAALGEVITERSGVLNVAIEGLMALGASVGFLAAYLAASNGVGIGAAMAAGGLIGLLLAYGTISLQVSQLTLGLALHVLCVGLASLLYRLVVGLQFVPPQIQTFRGKGGDTLWQVLTGLPGPVYAVLLLAVVVHVIIFHTPVGLRLRACGENPRAADLLGVNVFRIRYLATVVGSMLIAAAGALLPMMLTATYSDRMIGGRGWIALMLVILGRWLPFRIVLGGWLFGYVEALQYRLGLQLVTVPPQFLLMLPYVFVILVAIRAYGGAAGPQALMRPYDREARG
ncbi:MAG: ABC transporter permease [Thermaerobacter sp.]|nr:ABC transporter permease [Bacillota bacterium]REJ32747.1 MAG: ABC transporter permease [Bacillota bacterium]